MKNIKEPKNSNVCGIIGLCLSGIIPLVGFILGIVALSRREKTRALGVLAILISLIVGSLCASMIVSLIATFPF